MKCTDVSWRAVVGSFNVKTRSLSSSYTTDLISSILNRLLDETLLCNLLMIGGVELNPGPIQLTETTFRIIQSTLPQCKGSNNPIQTTSKWGRLSSLLYEKTSVPNQRFLKNFVDIFPKTEMEKYYDTSMGEVQQLLIQVKAANQVHINAKAKLIHERMFMNSSQPTGAWGIMATTLYHSNTTTDRTFLSKLFTISQQVDESSIPDLTNLHIVDLPRPQLKQREKRAYKREYFQEQNPKRRYPSGGNSTNESIHDVIEPLQPINPTSDLTAEIIQQFKSSVWQFPSISCDICDQLVYPKLIKSFIVTDAIRQVFFETDKEEHLKSNLKLCSRCHGYLGRLEVPPKALCNRIRLRPIPDVIARLTSAEVRLISQVKPYMKIYLSCRGQGQKAMRGMVIHFPQPVTEVIQQLPLASNNSDLIIVNETSDRSLYAREMTINPKSIYNALVWFKQNNPLYHDIVIGNCDSIESIQSIVTAGPSEIIIPAVIDYQIPGIGYRTLTGGGFCLRASVHQGNPMFGTNAGSQCTAMAAAFLAHTFANSPLTWTKQDLDPILISGNSWYTEKKSLIEGAHIYLEPEEVVGRITVFGGLDVDLSINFEFLASFNGFLNIARGNDLPRLTEQIQHFIQNGFEFAIITTMNYSMGLHITPTFAYYFDSHCRGLNGCPAPTNGTACVLKYDVIDAPFKISSLIHRNCAPRRALPNINDMYFKITPFTIEYPANENTLPPQIVQDLELVPPSQSAVILQSLIPISAEYTLSPIAISSPLEIFPDSPDQTHILADPDEIDNNDVLNEIIQDFGQIHNMDCVIDREDFLEPHIDAIITERVDLRRTTANPLSAAYEKDLDLLAFPHLFPYAQNGLNQDFRKPSITPLDYFQQRLMSSDKRFAGNTDFLFYALSICDAFRARQKISICCNMKKQGNPNDDGALEQADIRDPHVYMNAIRGSSSYWKRYTGDVIAMIKQLGIPHFFLTFSYDDLNSSDAVNALWKAKHGFDAPDVNPQDIPYDERKSLLNDYSIAAARQFAMRLSKLLASLKSNSENIFGYKLVDFTVRIEFQDRGSPHVHGLLWFDNPPSWETPEGIAFLDRNVSCSLSTENRDLVLKYQSHRHTKTCFRNKSKVCRFAFPKTVSDHTRILPPDEIDQRRGRFFELKREPAEVMINSYHPILLQMLKCNMDISPVTGEMGIAYYIGKYISKSEPTELKPEIQEAITKINNSSLPARSKMLQISNTIMRNRSISGQEAAFRLCHLPLRQSSRTTVFIPTYKKENRVRMLKRESLLQGNPEFCNNIIDRYMARPLYLSPICLFEFAAHWIPSRRAKLSVEDDDDLHEFPDALDIGDPGTKIVLNLLNNMGRIESRNRPAVIKYPNFNPISDRDAYHYAMVLLYLPFREENFCNGDISSEQAFQDNHTNFRKHSDNSIIKLDLAIEIDRALLRLTEFGQEPQMNEEGDIIASDEEHPFSMDYAERQDEREVISLDDVFPRGQRDKASVTARIVELYATLTTEQKKIFDQVKVLLTTRDEAGKMMLNGGYRLFISAEGGAGKTYLLQLIIMYIRNYLSEDSMIVAAPTGKSAFLLDFGVTLHSAFSLPIELDRVGGYHKLGARKLAQLRQTYQNVSFIAIDEISMVNYETLRMIHLRLGEIFDTDELLGGRHVFVLGDLLQLAPPRGALIFRKPDRYAVEVDLWRQFNFEELTVNMRQGDDPILPICRRLRIGELTVADIKVLETRRIDPKKPNYAQLEREFEEAIRIFPTLQECDNYNARMTAKLKLNGNVFSIKAKDTYADGNHFGELCDPSIVPTDANKTGGMLGNIELGVNSRLMLRRNLNTRRGLTNGALGRVRSFKWTIDPDRQLVKGDLPRSVTVKFDHMDEPQVIECVTVDFTGKKQSRISRRMVPFLLASGISTHKMQGQSVKQAVINLGSKLFCSGLAYVSLSRVTSLNGLAITEISMKKLMSTPKYSPANMKAFDELQRLRGNVIVQRK